MYKVTHITIEAWMLTEIDVGVSKIYVTQSIKIKYEAIP